MGSGEGSMALTINFWHELKLYKKSLHSRLLFDQLPFEPSRHGLEIRTRPILNISLSLAHRPTSGYGKQETILTQTKENLVRTRLVAVKTSFCLNLKLISSSTAVNIVSSKKDSLFNSALSLSDPKNLAKT